MLCCSCVQYCFINNFFILIIFIILEWESIVVCYDLTSIIAGFSSKGGGGGGGGSFPQDIAKGSKYLKNTSKYYFRI